MIINYIKIALRHMLRFKFYSILNISGLAVGLACCIMIFLYVYDEISFDRFHERSDRIYRVHVGDKQTVTPTILAPTLERVYPEVDKAARMYRASMVVTYGEHTFNERRFLFADSSFFSIFSFPFIEGDPRHALTRPRTVVLTESTAKKYFGDDPAVGKTLRINSQTEYEITGVIGEVGENSHFKFDFVASFTTTHWSQSEEWFPANFFTYVLLHEGQSIDALQRKIDAMVDGHRHLGLPNEYRFILYPMTDIYLQYDGRITYVYIFGTIALLILLIASINYMNLATARSVRRAREVGIRKTTGAVRGQLIGQFYAESALTTVLALGLSFILIELFLPYFNTLSGKQLQAHYIGDWWMTGTLAVIAAIVIMVSGSYPALLLSSFQPVLVLKGSFTKDSRGILFRKVLVVFQFSISVVLIIGTVVVFHQLKYIQDKNLGFDKEHAVVVPMNDRGVRESYRAMKDELLQHPRIVNVSAMNSIPGYQRGGYRLIAEGLTMDPGEWFPIRGVPADRHVVETLGLDLIAGNGFTVSEKYNPESGNYVYIVNKATVQQLGWDIDDAIGKRMGLSEGRMGILAGVVRDFHFDSLHEPVKPIAFFIEPRGYFTYVVRIKPEEIRETIAYLENTWSKFAPKTPFEFTFLDSEIDKLYRSEERLGNIFASFSILAIFIACLGLLGLSAFATQQRTKEIGVRKVLGASVGQLVFLLSKEFSKWVLIANIIAWPIAYYIMNMWLENFAYRTEIGVSVFVVSAVLTFVIALVTVSYQSVRAALAHPIKSLRYE